MNGSHHRNLSDVRWLFAAVVFLIAMSGMCIFSASSLASLQKGMVSSSLLSQHMISLCVALCGFILFSTIPLSLIQFHAPLLLGVSLIAGTLVIFTPPLRGIHRWISVWGVSFQPMEMIKLFFMLSLGSLFVQRILDKNTFVRSVVPLVVFTILVSTIAFFQGDMLSIVLVTATTMLVLIAAEKRPLYNLSFIAFSILFTALLGWYFFDRIQMWMQIAHPWSTSAVLGKTDSLLMIGSSGWWGAGVAYTNYPLAHIPRAHADGIFPLLAQYSGFVGCISVIVAYLIIALTGISIARSIRESKASYTILAFVTLLSFQALLSISAALGLFPVGSVGAPFLSFGGSGLLSYACMLGFIWQAARRQWKESRAEEERAPSPFEVASHQSDNTFGMM